MFRHFAAPSLALVLILVSTSSSQQFQQVVGAVPGPVVWSEGVLAFDANGDGWTDVMYTNGVGFSSAGGALAPTLLMNQAIPGTATFLDQTATRIPAGFVQQGKAITAADVDGDGDQDVIFGNGFLTQPRILINDGTGVFTDQTATRFPNLNLSAFGVAAGDVDDDGDIDLAFCDAGPNLLAAPGGLARLFINDGTGVFTNSPTRMNAMPKIGAMQVNMVDVDNDFDLDITVDGRSTGQQLYVNDGSGTFTFNGTALPAGSTAIYEIDWADLDNDDDMDAVYISLSGQNEGTARNDTNGSTLSFSGTTATFTGLNGNDDNEVVFIDANNDGIIDVLIGSLANNREKLYLNAGTLANASLTYQTNGFTQITDSTLDAAVADFDRDGDYDIVTAQGESGSFLNRYYTNTGPADTIGPRIGRMQMRDAVTLQMAMAGVPVRAWIQDATFDNGQNFVTAVMNYSVTKGPFSQTGSMAMEHVGGGIFRAVIPAATTPIGLVGADVGWSVVATDAQGNATTSATTSFKICGIENYGTLGAANDMTIGAANLAVIGTTFNVTLAGAPPSQNGALLIGVARDAFPALGGTIYVNTTSFLLEPMATDPLGAATIPLQVPFVPALAGFIADAQGICFNPAAAALWSLSDGLEIAICPPLFPPPAITNVNPPVALPGALITITGSGFQSGATVLVGGSPATVTSQNSSQIQFLNPAGVGCDVSLVVINPDGQSAATTFSPSPTVTTTVFGSGSAAGGATFIIVGSSFLTGTTVTIGGASATVNSVTTNSINCTTPAGTMGIQPVVITTPLGCTAMTTYTYL